MSLELRHLKLIVAIVEEGSVTRAAVRLRLTQPALSHQLHAIEHYVGEPIFVRSRKGMRLTPRGEALHATACRVLAAFDEFDREARRVPPVRASLLRLTVEPDAWAQQAVELFQTQHPGLEVQLVPSAHGRPSDALVAGCIDLAVLTRPVAGKAVRLTPLFRDEVVVIVRPDHALAARPYCEVDDLFGEPLLMSQGSAEEHLLRATALEQDEVTSNRVADVQVTGAIPSLVAAGFGISVTSRLAVVQAIAAGEVVALPLTRHGSWRTWTAATRPGDELSGPIRGFVDEMTALALRAGATPC